MISLNKSLLIFSLSLALPASGGRHLHAAFAPNQVQATQLRCEYHAAPLGIDAAQPRLSWQLRSAARGQKQTAYQVLVASSAVKLQSDIGDLWNSGKVNSDTSIHITYQGKALQSNNTCYWKVKVWNQDGKASAWSAPSVWTMGLLKREDWKAKWIGFDPTEPVTKLGPPDRKITSEIKTKGYLPSPYLRKPFKLSGKIVRATLHATAQGVLEIHLNGKRVGNEYFTPGWTDYHKRIYYRTYDVTTMLKDGDNLIGAILGDGWFRGNISILGQNQYGDKLRLLSQLHVEYADGSSEVIASDSSWKASFGPIILSDMQEGETYDARKELSGWDQANYDDSLWHPVSSGSEIAPAIESYPGTPVRQTEMLKTISVKTLPSGDAVFDLGQNFSGWARLKIQGKAGQKITMQFGEMLNDDGSVYTDNLRSAAATDHYLLKGEGLETWEPHFTFHGFRYVQMSGLETEAKADMVTGIVIHSDAPMSSAFSCSNSMLNQLYSNIIWGQRSNYLEVPTDCPQRDERMGWTGDTQVFIRTGCYNMDVGAFFTKWNIDLMDTQNEEGTFGQQAPVFHGWGSPAWADAGVICPWTIYKMYGDLRMVAKHYDQMAKFIAHCKHIGLSGHGGGFGDWLAIGSKTPKELISCAYFAYTTNMMAEIAEALGRADDAAKYRKLFAEIRAHFQKSFVEADGKITDESQTSYCLALHYHLLNKTQRAQAAIHLAQRIQANGYRLSTGFVGAGILLPTLTEIGRSDLAYRLVQSTEYPSWGYSIEQGATTIWERWNSYTLKDGFGDVNMNSFNHYAYGACGEWMFHSMLGIDLDSAGFKKITMKPETGQGVTWAKGHYDSIHGRIVSDWKTGGNRFRWNVTVPANTSATLYIPAQQIESITESGHAINHAEGVKFIRMEAGKAVLSVESGSYTFVSNR